MEECDGRGVTDQREVRDTGTARVTDRLSEGRGVRVYRVAAAEALRWGVEQCVSPLVLGP